MINKTLFKNEFKRNYKMLLIFLAIITIYISMIIMMFDPKLGESLDLMAKSMPEIFSAFGMAKPATTLIEFIGNYLYGFILIVIPLIFIILTANKIVGKYIDNGSMAYLLATPNKRKKIIITEGLFLIFNIVIIVLYATILAIIISTINFSGQLNIKDFIIMNVGLFGLLFFFGGLCFFSSATFNNTKLAYGLGGGVAVLFILIQMISQVGEKFEDLKYVTALTLFQPDKLAVGNTDSIIAFLFLYLMGIILYIAGIMIFNKRDLSL